MLYGELIIDQRIIGFWARIVKGKAAKIYHLLLNGNSYIWLENLITLFNNLGMSYILYTSIITSN